VPRGRGRAGEGPTLTSVARLDLPVGDPVAQQVSAAIHRPPRPSPTGGDESGSQEGSTFRGGSSFPADGSHPRGALLVPGAGGTLDDDGLATLAQLFADRGYVTVRANLPYREAGRRPPRAERNVASLERVLDAARVAAPPTHGDWVLGGKSYGGRVASLAVADGRLAAAGLVFYGYPLHPPGRPDRLRVEHWPRIEVPCLFLQGERDPFCDLALLEAHLPELAGPVTLHVVAGGDHSLRVTRAASPAGVPAAPKLTIAGLRPVVAAWLETVAAPPAGTAHA
jgi:uncharacterized protein